MHEWRNLANGFEVIATKPDREDRFMTVLAVAPDLSKYAIWTYRFEDKHTFEGEYFDYHVHMGHDKGPNETIYRTFMDAVEAFRER